MDGTSFITGDLKYLRLPITTNIKPGMKVLIVTGTAHVSAFEGVTSMAAVTPLLAAGGSLAPAP